MVVNAAQLATYSQAKQAILSSGYIQVFETMGHSFISRHTEDAIPFGQVLKFEQ